ncbi:polysaccharide biosynthesis protein [Lactobacillus sp. LC28-10]|uniref:Polysaccharide biosynthesis protein n=1 Tax=Secundilactobacillus angelensis TaxID=2722706 RepID=A0ABX1KY80_9LACO|nr:polysaccharide biosynthesis protein [Secundilactobacillus angelensis]MCH5463090.1 polysaccharide biosynthesis protein [Secundilactobacillus angelensis]NLR18897.1 polysaccharide biosynthesis protein [Secundilactobacillus angelensis]
MQRKTMKTVMQGALLLSVASLIAKILSAIYRVPFQNMVGNTGFYVYQQIYPIYGIGMTFALSGLPMFISKLVAESDSGEVKRSLISRIFIILAGFSLVVFLGLQVFALPIAGAMGDPGLTPIIRSVSWLFLFSPFLAVSRGYFQGQYEMRPTALSQLVEQAIRVGVILCVAYWAMKHHWNVYQMGKWAMSSAPIAAIFASAVMLYYVWQHQLKFLKPSAQLVTSDTSYGVLVKRLLIEGGTISLFASMMVLLQLVDSFTVMRGLMMQGTPPLIAKSIKGVYDRGQPLVQLGLVVATSFSSSLLPSLTESLVHGTHRQFVRQANTVIRMSLAIATAAAVGLIALMPEVNVLLFGNQQGNAVLSVYVLSIIFATLIMIDNSILQSLNQFAVTIAGLTLGLVVKVLLNQWAVIHFGAIGASWITVLALLLMTGFLMRQLRKEQLRALKHGFLPKLVLISLVMLIAVRLIIPVGNWLTAAWSPRMTALADAALGILVGVVIFVSLALKLKLLSLREWLLLPHAEHLLRWLNK